MHNLSKTEIKEIRAKWSKRMEEGPEPDPSEVIEMGELIISLCDTLLNEFPFTGKIWTYRNKKTGETVSFPYINSAYWGDDWECHVRECHVRFD